MLLKIALNGARPKSEHEFIPHSPDEIRNEVLLLYDAGCRVFHIHCYDKNGKESLKPEDIDNLVSAIKGISEDIEAGVSTGEWIEHGPAQTIECIRGWKRIPDFASVNMIEQDAVGVARELMNKGVAVEAGLNDKKAAEIFARSALRKDCLRILIEPEEKRFDEAISTVNEIEKILESANIKTARLLHGFDTVAWELLREVKKRGYDARAGMEDTLYLENGQKVKSNLEILKEAKKILDF